MISNTIDWIVIWITLLIFGIFLFIMLVFLIIENVSRKIHKSYHKGYNQAKDDKVEYYSTIHDLSESFDDIYDLFVSNELKIPFDLANRLVNYKELIKEFRER